MTYEVKLFEDKCRNNPLQLARHVHLHFAHLINWFHKLSINEKMRVLPIYSLSDSTIRLKKNSDKRNRFYNREKYNENQSIVKHMQISEHFKVNTTFMWSEWKKKIWRCLMVYNKYIQKNFLILASIVSQLKQSTRIYRHSRTHGDKTLQEREIVYSQISVATYR